MDINTKYADHYQKIPIKYYNQINTKSLTENYISEKDRVMDALLETDEPSETVVTINTVTKRN